MESRIIFMFIIIICLVFSGQIMGGRVVANSRFADEWQEIASNRQDILNQTDVEARKEYELAVAYANLGEIKKANKLFDRLGDKKWEQKLEKLITDYASDLEEKPENIKLINYLGFAYYIDHQYQQAEALFEKIINLDPKNIWSYNYLAVVQHELKKYKQAEKTLEQSMAIKKNEYTHFLLGVNYYKKGNLFKAAYHIGKGKKAANLFLND